MSQHQGSHPLLTMRGDIQVLCLRRQWFSTFKGSHHQTPSPPNLYCSQKKTSPFLEAPFPSRDFSSNGIGNADKDIFMLSIIRY